MRRAMYREIPSAKPDEVLCFIVRSIHTNPTLMTPFAHGTEQAVADVQHMQRLVNERLAQGFVVRDHKSVALDTEHALVTFVLAKIA
jgi:hypothetical protein